MRNTVKSNKERRLAILLMIIWLVASLLLIMHVITLKNHDTCIHTYGKFVERNGKIVSQNETWTKDNQHSLNISKTIQ